MRRGASALAAYASAAHAKVRSAARHIGSGRYRRGLRSAIVRPYRCARRPPIGVAGRRGPLFGTNMPRGLLRFLPLALIAGALVALVASGVLGELSLDAFEARRAALDAYVANHRLEALALYVAIFVIAMTLSLPAAFVLSVTGGYLFGVALGAPVIVFAATLGSTLFYLACRTALGDLLRRYTHGRLAMLEEGLRRNAFSYILMLRLTPVAPLFIVNLAAGLLDVRVRDFVLATALGLIPVSLVCASVGVGLRATMAAGGSADPVGAMQRLFFSPQVLAPILGLALLGSLPLLMRRFRRAGARTDA